MIYDEKKLLSDLKTIDKYNILYFYSTEEFLVQNAYLKVLSVLEKQGEAEITFIDGPNPDLEQLEISLGTISFLGGRRVIVLNKIEPSAMVDSAVHELCSLLGEVQDTVVIITTVFKDDKSHLTKKAKSIQEVAEKNGLNAQFLVPNTKDMYSFLKGLAQGLDTVISPQVATELIEVCGSDLLKLETEIQKLSAVSGYTEITQEHIRKISSKNITADAFEMIRHITNKNTKMAFGKLSELIYLQNQPIAITAAISSSFIDMYRVKCGANNGINYSKVFKDMNYKGSDYRLKMSLQNANKYTLQQLSTAIQILKQLDLDLKSSPVDNIVLLETTIAQLIGR